ncbi:MAG TPA: YtxH domain-containing protein [Sporosarcina sp.]|mgnify:CR=1 FL=1|nr:YtxH domain-containing protein [Sporosarcina sp.]
MGKKKFCTFMFLGAVIGGAASLLDKKTREDVIGTSKKAVTTVQYYAQNKDELKEKVTQEKEKYEMIFNKFSEDAAYIKNKVDEAKELVPQVKTLVEDTKEAFVESKDDYKAFVQEAQEGTTELSVGK